MTTYDNDRDACPDWSYDSHRGWLRSPESDEQGQGGVVAQTEPADVLSGPYATQCPNCRTVGGIWVIEARDVLVCSSCGHEWSPLSRGNRRYRP